MQRETEMHNASDYGFSIAGQLPAASERGDELARYRTALGEIARMVGRHHFASDAEYIAAVAHRASDVLNDGG